MWRLGEVEFKVNLGYLVRGPQNETTPPTPTNKQPKTPLSTYIPNRQTKSQGAWFGYRPLAWLAPAPRHRRKTTATKANRKPLRAQGDSERDGEETANGS